MNGLTKDDIRTIVREEVTHAMDIHNSGPHHDFVVSMMERENIKKERLEKLKTQIVGWSIIAFLGYVGSLVGDHVRTLLDLAIKHWK